MPTIFSTRYTFKNVYAYLPCLHLQFLPLKKLMKGVDKEQWRSTVALQNDAMKKKIFFNLELLAFEMEKSTFIN